MRESATDWYFFPIFLIIAASTFVGSYWRFFVQWMDGIRGRDWAKVSALIDVVSVVPQTLQTKYGERVVGYLATLTYFYHNPELQVGEFSRMFDLENDAQTWAASYKGRNVSVHIDPRDITRSVLRKEDL